MTGQGPVRPDDLRTLETVYTNAWRDEPGVRTQRGRAGIAAVARAVVPPGYQVVPIGDAPAAELADSNDFTRELRELRKKRGW
jgi:hypothetical protein